MNTHTRCQLGDDLLNAYLATNYRVILDGESENVRIGQTHLRLDRMTGATRWTIITAFNPGSRQFADSDNRQRHRLLQSTVKSAGLTSRPTLHIADDGLWPNEKGLFIPDVEDEWIHELAHEFGQNGIVHGHRHAPAELWLYASFSPQPDRPHVRALR